MLDRCMNTVFEPLLSEPWVLGLHATVKTFYGKQEEARFGYNPMKPARPSQVYHAYCIARLGMLLNVDVQAGNQVTSERACGAAGLVGLAVARAVAGDVAR